MILETSTRMEGPVNVVELRGRLALGNTLREAEDTIKKIVGQPGSKTVLDLSAVDFTDSAGIGMIMICNSTAVTAGAALRIAGPTARVRSVLELTRVDRVLSLYASTAEALKGF